MSKNNIEIRTELSGLDLPTLKWQVEAGSTAILAGEPVKAKVAGSNYVIPLADAEPVIGTTSAFFGIAQGDSSQSASADGSIDVWAPQQGVVYIADAKDSAAVDTQAEYDALVGKRVVLDLTAGEYTVDTAAVDAEANGIMIVSLNVLKNVGKVAFIVRNQASVFSGCCPTS